MSQGETEEKYVVMEGESNLSIQHSRFGSDNKTSAWEATLLDTNYLLVSKSKVSLGGAGAYAFLPVSVFKDVLLGLHESRWSGVLKVDCAGFLKKIFIRDGNLCFASSTLIDDRLGERLYRTGKITIDQLVESASQVGRDRKFGQVLIQSSVMNAVELWEALKDQVLDIFRSVFIPDFTKFVLEEGEHKAFMEVVYEVPMSKLINECFSYACMLRDFGRRLPGEAGLNINHNHVDKVTQSSGTFVGDMIELIESTSNVSELLEKSKLRPHNTIAVLLELVNQGVCRLSSDISEKASLKELSSKLNAKVDLFTLLHQHAYKGFGEHQLEFPVKELRRFALDSNDEGDTAFALDEQGRIDSNCRQNIMSQCGENQHRTRHFERLVDSITHFLLQLTIDLAPRDLANEVRAKYKEMS